LEITPASSMNLASHLSISEYTSAACAYIFYIIASFDRKIKYLTEKY